MTGGLGEDTLYLSNYSTTAISKATFTDFDAQADNVGFEYRSNGFYLSKGDFIEHFDDNLDGSITRQDGSSGSSAYGESYIFATDAQGDSVLTMNLGQN